MDSRKNKFSESGGVDMIGIVIPAHNEEEHLIKCIKSLKQAIQIIDHYPENIEILIVLDSCTDQSLNIVNQLEMSYLLCNEQCVGKARDLGVRHLILKGAQWIACTDADTCVDIQWLQQQIDHQPIDMICGVVDLDCFNKLSKSAQEKYKAHYQDQMDHRHIHGANLSFSSEAYLKVGGFPPVCCHEDVRLVEQFLKHQYKIIWSNSVRVTTSSRLIARAPNGLSTFLNKLDIQ